MSSVDVIFRSLMQSGVTGLSVAAQLQRLYRLQDNIRLQRIDDDRGLQAALTATPHVTVSPVHANVLAEVLKRDKLFVGVGGPQPVAPGLMQQLENLVIRCQRTYRLRYDPRFWSETYPPAVPIFLLESVIRELLQTDCDLPIKQVMVQGLWSLLCHEMQVIEPTLAAKLQQPFLRTVPTDPLTRWQMAHFMRLLMRAQLFEGGQPENGVSVLPLFGLADIDLYAYASATWAFCEKQGLAFIDAYGEELLSAEARLSGATKMSEFL